MIVDEDGSAAKFLHERLGRYVALNIKIFKMASTFCAVSHADVYKIKTDRRGVISPAEYHVSVATKGIFRNGSTIPFRTWAEVEKWLDKHNMVEE